MKREVRKIKSQNGITHCFLKRLRERFQKYGNFFVNHFKEQFLGLELRNSSKQHFQFSRKSHLSSSLEILVKHF